MEETKKDYVRLDSVFEESKSDKKEQLQIEGVINKMMGGSTPTYLLLYFIGTFSRLSSSFVVYLPVFTGYMPYTEWECLSPTCFRLLANHTHQNTTPFYTRAGMCDNALQAGEDFTWTSDRTYFSTDWGLYCGNEHKSSSISSFLFIGAFLGLLTATSMLDVIGRKKTTLIGAAIVVIVTLCGAFTNSVNLMLAVRVAQGYGGYISSAGMIIWSLEFTPTSLRNMQNALSGFMWTFGTLTLAFVSYWVKDWRYIFVVASVFKLLAVVPLLFYPESPRFLLVKGREPEARKIVAGVAKIFKSPISFKNAEFVYSSRKQNYLDQLRDFLRFPKMLKTTCLLMIGWFVVACLYYGLSFGWHKIGNNLFSSIGFAAVGEILAFGTGFSVIATIGRKRSLVLCFGGAALSFLAAVSNLSISGEWDLQRVACMVAIVFIGGAFLTIYLLTQELAPTSHRGMILCVCSCAARVGSFLGPYISLLYDVVPDRRIVPGIMVVAAALACSVTMMVGDSTGKPIPDTPHDLEGEEGVKTVGNGGDTC